MIVHLNIIRPQIYAHLPGEPRSEGFCCQSLMEVEMRTISRILFWAYRLCNQFPSFRLFQCPPSECRSTVDASLSSDLDAHFLLISFQLTSFVADSKIHSTHSSSGNWWSTDRGFVSSDFDDREDGFCVLEPKKIFRAYCLSRRSP